MQIRKNKKRTLFDDHSSKVKHILIPLFHFKGFHQTVSEEEGDEDFVGRKPIIGKLKAWLADTGSTNGAYLITGLRGMGKSSFVGETLYELIWKKESKHWSNLGRRLGSCLPWGLVGLVCFCSVDGILSAVFAALQNRSLWGIVAAVVYLLLFLVLIGYCRKNRLRFLVIKINVGNETMGNREILHLITKSAYDKFKEYCRNCQDSVVASLFFLIGKLTITAYLFHTLPPLLLLPDGKYWVCSTAYLLSLAHRYPWLGGCLFFFLLYSLVTVVSRHIVSWAGRLEVLPFRSGHDLLHRLYRLHERFIATVSEEPGTMNRHTVFSLFHRKEYRTLSAHEMEQELIGIFADMGKLLFGELRLVIILDELDKIYPSGEGQEQDLVPEFNPSVGSLDGKNGPRSRQRELLRMLASMKFFISTARAKFLFIAGRDLYEAYLKDVSDREFVVSSMFNGVINVQSFLKPGDSKGDITSLTENFVCARLIDRKATEKTLQVYFREEMKRIEGLNEEDKTVQRKRLERNVALLYQFIFYLVHVSNGSPKKTAVYFERYVRTREYLEGVKGMLLEEPLRKCSYYLSFGTKDIQKIGFVHYVAYPVTQVMINKSKVYEDKLLVSVSFMISHIYKFHNTGFSWRNLEHIPELLEINKTPELRDFIGTIISFLRKTHLTRILSGLYLFKFPMKISEEISFMSKQSEDVSALFNFSQGESLSIRNHYINLLDYYSRDINRIEGKELHAMASIHHILGDLYQEDEDYSQAIFEYQTGLQLLSGQLQGREYDNNPHWVSYMLFLVRNMLKLGLTYEKRKTLDSAYMAYSELVQHMVDYRFLNEKEFGLHYRIEDSGSKQDKDALLFFDAQDGSKGAKAMFPGLGEAEQKQGFAFQCDHLKTEFARLLTPLKNSVVTRMAFFDDVRMAYLPILAKLSVLEKMNMEGITQHNLDVAEAEFFFLHLATDDSEKVMAAADFYNKFGDILYYKNGLVNQRPGNLFLSLYFWGYDLGALKDALCAPCLAQRGKKSEKEMNYHVCRKQVEGWFDEQAGPEQKNITDKAGLVSYMKQETGRRMEKKYAEKVDWEKLFDDSFEERVSLKKVTACVRHREKFARKGLRAPCYACKYYNQAMNMELERMMGWKWNAERRKLSKAVVVAKLLLEERPLIRSMRETQHSIIGDTLKGLGCTFMGCADKEETVEKEFLETFFKILRAFYQELPMFMPSVKPGAGKEGPGKLEKAMLLFWEASVFYEMTGDSRSAYELNRHLVETLENYLKVNPDKVGDITPFLPEIKTLIVDRGIMNLYAHYDHVHLVEIQRMKAISGREVYEDIGMGILPASPDIEELLYHYCMLEGCCRPDGDWKSKLYKSGLMGPYKHICTLTQDIQNLRMKVVMNERTFLDVLPGMGWTFADCKYPDATRFYELLADFLNGGEEIKVDGLYEEGDRPDDRLALLEFLVVDTLFCLARIVNVITPLNNTTLYTNTFIGEVYEHLWKWTVFFEWVYLCCKEADGSGMTVFEVLKRKYRLTDTIDKPLFDKAVDGICRIMEQRSRKPEKKEALSKELRRKVMDAVGVDSFRHLTRTDQMESAARYYRRGVEMHSEGKAYKEMIRTLFFLDDDLNNDTCQLAFGLERFRINTGWIHERLRCLRAYTASASAYNLEEYLKS